MKSWILLPLLAAWIVPPADQPAVQKDFVTLGSAKVLDDRCIRLTPDAPWASGSAWAKAPIDLDEPFDMTVSLRFGDRDALGADGVVFVLSPTPRTGWRGEGIGFAGLRGALGIELDTYQNAYRGDPAADHLALLVGGVVHHDGRGSIVELPNLEDGRLHALRVTWAPQASALTVALDGEQVAAYPGDLVRRVLGAGPVHWGVTAATGRKTNAHDVCLPSSAPAGRSTAKKSWWPWFLRR